MVRAATPPMTPPAMAVDERVVSLAMRERRAFDSRPTGVLEPAAAVDEGLDSHSMSAHEPLHISLHPKYRCNSRVGEGGIDARGVGEDGLGILTCESLEVSICSNTSSSEDREQRVPSFVARQAVELPAETRIGLLV